MANAVGNPLGTRPTEGYSKNVQATDDRILDANGNPVLTEIGDAWAGGVRIGGGFGRGIFLLLLYIAGGGPAMGMSVFEFLSAAGLEIDPSLASLTATSTTNPATGAAIQTGAGTITTAGALDNDPDGFLGPNP